ncbi:MAG: NAD(P)H-dependent oxidoreductase subunit E [Candidatus Bathyarchaeota archaeon]|nr:NAD(P)H-dependent oxidoreductase subunit E [Candidatus Bathyarchaeota archaeon]
MQKTIVLPTQRELQMQQDIEAITANATRKDLIQVLQAVQEKYGYLPQESLRLISKNMGVSRSEVYGVATFYHQFRLDPPGQYVIQVCMGTGCHAKGNADNYEHLKVLLGLKGDQTVTQDKVFSIEAARCFGCCSLAPVVAVTDSTGEYRRVYGSVDQKVLKKIIAEHREKAQNQESEPQRETIVCQRK